MMNSPLGALLLGALSSYTRPSPPLRKDLRLNTWTWRILVRCAYTAVGSRVRGKPREAV